jgi:hypothetical protein
MQFCSDICQAVKAADETWKAVKCQNYKHLYCVKNIPTYLLHLSQHFEIITQATYGEIVLSGQTF